jgi:hypothetical protein
MTNVLLAGFTSHWLRRESSMKTAERKTHKRCAVVRSVPSPWNGRREQILLDNKWGWKSTKIRPKVKCFLLTSPLIEPLQVRDLHRAFFVGIGGAVIVV